MNYECPICLEQIIWPTVGSCMHHFCYFCLLKHCKFSNQCPMCKNEIYEIKFDREFNSLVNGDNVPTFKYPNETLIYNYDDFKDPGLTIKNNLKGPGVVISNIKTSGLFFKYNFKEKDILLFINDVPCENHIFVMKQIMFLFQSNKLMKIIKM